MKAGIHLLECCGPPAFTHIPSGMDLKCYIKHGFLVGGVSIIRDHKIKTKD
jgi:hypothetical protein